MGGKKTNSKSKGKTSSTRAHENEEQEYDSDGSCQSDLWSTTSNPDDNQTVVDREAQSTELIIAKVRDSLELLENSKTTRDHLNCYTRLITLFQRNLLTDYLSSNYYTISDLALKSLRKDAAVASKAAHLLVLLYIQLGGDALAIVNSDIRLGLETASQNSVFAWSTRGYFLKCLAVCSFFNDDTDSDEKLLASLEAFILGTMKKEIIPLVISSLDSWVILAVQFNEGRVLKEDEKMLFRLLTIFEEFHDNLDLRLSAGSALCLIYHAKMCLGDRGNVKARKFQKHDELYDTLNELWNQGNKVVGKKDKRVHKSALRDALLFMDNEHPEFDGEIRVKDEVLDVSDLKTQIIYDTFTEFLATGLYTHLASNPVLRSESLFDLGPVRNVDANLSDRKQLKERQKLYFQESHKLSKQHRQKNRDRRSAQVSDDYE